MNPKIKNIKTEVLSDNWYVLRKVTFDFKQKNGNWQTQSREAYDRGNGAVVLLYNNESKTVILTRQFRMPTYLNGNPDGMLIEACAGLLDADNPEDCIRKEIQEVYMSPGSVTEILYFFVATYTKDQQRNNGGGVEDEEEIEVLELGFQESLEMIKSGEIKDAKTIMLLQYLQINHLIAS
jgi:GDP-mannose pyrophosphatase NudK